MKKTIIILIMVLTSYFSSSQTIQSLNVSPNGTETVDVNLEVFEIHYINFISYYDYELMGNQIYLKVCYEFSTVNAVTELNNTFNISILNPNNYTLNIEIYRTDLLTTCDYTDLTDTATLEFTTPLTDTVYLGVAEFEEVTNQITVFPNPVKDFLNIKVSGSLDIKNIEIYNMLGSRIKSYSNTFESLDVRGLSNGMYFLRFRTNKGMVTKKILVSN